MKNPLLLLPLAVFLVIGAFAIKGLTLDQTKQPSNLIDKPAPTVMLDPMPGLGEPFSPEDLKGDVSLVNVFGSWCAACRIEHPLLMEIGESDIVDLYGIDWADTPERGAAWLAQYGNPYDKVGNDEAGRAVIEYGVTGAPETFVVDAEGRIRYRHVGPVDRRVWRETIEPLIQRLREEAATPATAPDPA